jgi:Tfp pilus assembly protein PilZ
MIFTFSAHMGDFLILWPVASWYYKNKGEKIHFVVTQNYSLYEKLIPLLHCQDFTEKVTLVDVPRNTHVFNPINYGISGDYMNFGFHVDHTPFYGKWVPFYYASTYNLGVDMDFRIKYPKMEVPKYERIWIDTEPGRSLYGSLPKYVPEPRHKLDITKPIIENINIAVNADEVWSHGTGFTVLLEFVDKPSTIVVPGKDPYMQFIRANAYPDHPIQHKWIFI